MSVVSVSPGPALVTDRLELWLPRVPDVEAMIGIVSDPETHRFLGPQGSHAEHYTRILRNAGSWMLYGYGIFAVKRREDGELIGNCGIFHSMRGLGEDFDDRAEAGWILRKDCTGQGHAEEAMRAALDWFDGEFGREVMCLISMGNTPSMKLAGKLGFTPLREAEMPDGDAVQLFRRPPSTPS